jgi:DNA-directed RNA polymerase subunit alpha
VAFQVECVDTTVAKDQSQYGKFVIDALERGQGTTVGNALRRTLLANLGGTAVTAVRIAGVSHEFATIPGVREDVLDILLNVKQIVLNSTIDQPQIGRLHVQGPAMVTAGHIDISPEVEVVNPNQYIATIAAGTNLEMEFKVERGKGYRTFERGREDVTAMDFLQIDAVFMPVHKVNYTVEGTLSPENDDTDRVSLEIWTNGSLTPQEALSEASNKLVELFNPLREINFEAPGEEEPQERPESQVPIEELQLSVRAYNCLKRAQINTVADLLDYSQEDLLEIKNFGQKSAEEVVEALQQRLGITLPQSKHSA